MTPGTPRVALIGPAPPALGGRTPGGVATHLLHLVEGLSAAGVEVSLLVTNLLAGSPEAWQDGGRSYAVYRMHLPAGPLGWLDPGYMGAVGPGTLARYAWHLARHTGQPLGSRRIALAHLVWYRHFVLAVRPQLLHVQHPLERHLYARLLAEYEGWRLPLVVTLHSFFNEHPEHLVQQVMRPNLPRADRLIAVSRSTAEQAVQLGADPARIRVIRSGVDAARFRPRDRAGARARLGVARDLPLLLFVGNLEPRKAVDRLLLALAHVRRTVPEATLAIVGTGEAAGADDQEPRLRRMAEELGLAPAVWFLGRVADERLPDWYAAADVFALPSSSEGQGIAALEAMAAGLPVVVSAVGGLRDTVEDGRTGYLVPFGDVEALARRVADLLADPERRAAVGAAAREAVVRDFSWERSVAATVEVYREALESAPSPSTDEHAPGRERAHA